jgi:hypothetical protein
MPYYTLAINFLFWVWWVVALYFIVSIGDIAPDEKWEWVPKIQLSQLSTWMLIVHITAFVWL